MAAQPTRRARRAGSDRSVVRAWLCVLGALLPSALGAQASQGSPAPAPQGNAESGRRLFVARYCHACHGTVGQGGAAGARIAGRSLAFGAFQKYVRQPTGQMPPYPVALLSDRDLADLYEFLRTMPPPPSAAAIPLLNQ